MNYMEVSRLAALRAGRTAGDISQAHDGQSALPPPEKIARDRPSTRNACTATKTATLRRYVVQPTRGQLLAAKIGVSGSVFPWSGHACRLRGLGCVLFSTVGLVVAQPSSGPVAFPEPVSAFAGDSLQRVQEVGDAGHVRRGLLLCFGRFLSFLRRSGVLVLLGLTRIGVPHRTVIGSPAVRVS